MHTFTVLGPPATKGSTVSFVADGRVVTKADCRTLAEWTQAVKWMAKNARVPLIPRPHAVRIAVQFEVEKPKKVEKDRVYPTVKPDIDKLERALLDALTSIAYEDDAQVCDVIKTKRYSAEPRTIVTIERM